MWVCVELSGMQQDRPQVSTPRSHQEEEPPKGKGAPLPTFALQYEEPQVVLAAPAQTQHPQPGSNVLAEKGLI